MLTKSQLIEQIIGNLQGFVEDQETVTATTSAIGPTDTTFTVDDRSADITRTPGDIPVDGVGVYLDLVTYAGSLVFPLTPVVHGFLDTGSAVPYAIQNISGGSASVTTTFTFFS